MAEYYEHFKMSKEELIGEMQHAPDVAYEMEKEDIISFDERYGIIAMKDKTLRKKRILELIEKTYQFKKFIKILERTKNERCLALFKDWSKFMTPTEEDLHSQLQSARDVIRDQENRILELQREKGNLEKKARQLELELKHSRLQTKVYHQKEKQLNDAKKKIVDLENTISCLENTSGTKSEKIDHLEGKLDLQNKQIQTLTEEHKKSTAEMKKHIDESHRSLSGQMGEIIKMMSEQKLKDENSSDFDIQQSQVRKSVDKLPPIKKK